MSFFFLDHRVSYTKQVNVPLKTVLAFLHDPPAIMQLSPLITSVSVDPDDSTKHTISDSLVLPFGFHTNIVYHATVTLNEDGMRAESLAGAGTRTISTYRARAISDGVTEIREEAIINVRKMPGKGIVG